MYLLIRLGWGGKFILPYDEGMTVVHSLQNAQVLDGEGTTQTIRPLRWDEISFNIVSEDAYKQFISQQPPGTRTE